MLGIAGRQAEAILGPVRQHDRHIPLNSIATSQSVSFLLKCSSQAHKGPTEQINKTSGHKYKHMQIHSQYTEFLYFYFTLKVHSFVNNFLAGGKIDTSLKIFAYKYESVLAQGYTHPSRPLQSPPGPHSGTRTFCQAAKRQSFPVKLI